MKEQATLNTVELLPELIGMKVSALNVEGRQRSPAYVAQVTKVLRTAIDAAIKDPETLDLRQAGWVN